MGEQVIPEFEWRSSNATNIVTHKGNEYWIVITPVTFDNYYISLYENRLCILSCFTDQLEIFADTIDSLLENILLFGNNMIKNHILECLMCNKEKVVFELEESYREKCSFEYLCFQCEQIVSRETKTNEDDDREFIIELQKNPPKIIGGFVRKTDAFRSLCKFNEYENIETYEDGYVYAKGIIQVNDGTYYPVFLTISISSSGEHCGTDFIAENWDSPIPDIYAEQYIGKVKEKIYPYTYTTIEHIEGDYHQDIWLGRYQGNDVRSHLVNFVEENWVRPYFSIQHLQSAAHLTRKSGVSEKRYTGFMSNTAFSEHRTYVTASILSAVAFVESTINEILSDVRENPYKGVVADLDVDIIRLIKNVLENDGFKLPVLKKYQLILTLCGKNPFEKGKKLFQEISMVIRLRNLLVHFEPSNILIDGDTSYKHFEGKFAINPLAGQSNPFFPDKCLSYGCAKWALETCLEFTDVFLEKLELFPLYYRYKNEIKKMIEML